jgi:LmbE family N-acetylglucosaminyl deacetylase
LNRRVAWLAVPILIALAASRGFTQFPPAPGTGPGLAETIEAIDSARVTTRILYITAHPDDESAAVLTYLARGLHADVALLSVTRGEGGQNDLGPEQAPQLGMIRTQELLAATRGYGVKLYFTRARDFGFSKTPEETEKIWGDAVLEDMVRVIRTFRPQVVIDHFGGVHGGHGHHQTAGLWAPKAVALAADPAAFSEHLKGTLPPWKGEYQHPVQILDIDRGESPKGYMLSVDDISPLWGRSYRQIGMDAFANHRTQAIAGVLSSPFFRRPFALAPEGDGKIEAQTLAQPLRSMLPGCKAFGEADDQLQAARTAALRLDWNAATASLAQAAGDTSRWLDKCPWHLANDLAQRFEVADMNRPAARVEKALALAAGLRVTAEADRSELVVGENFSVNAQVVCRAEAGCHLGETRLASSLSFKETKREGDIAKGLQLTVQTDASAPPKQTDLGELLSASGKNQFPSEWDPTQPEPPPAVTVQQEVTIDGYKFQVTTQVSHVEATSTRADRVLLHLAPAYTLSVEPKQAVHVLAQTGRQFDVLLRVHSHATQPGKVSTGLDVPAGWTAGSPVALEFPGSGDRYARLHVTPPPNLSAGTFHVDAYVQRGAEKFTESLEPLPTLPTQLWSEPAQCLVHAFEIRVPENQLVGYITAESEPVPDALQRLGIHIEMLDPAALAFGDLSRFSAIVVGVRAYELRSDLRSANQRLLDYASNGGTVVVQYNRDSAWNNAQYAPYPAKIGGGSMLPRVTDENSPVRFLKPDDPLLNQPNKITQDDFKGWVQERGLYFWTQFDLKYTPLLAMNDPGEPEQNGSLVYTRYGKGLYIYTGLAFFRQLPEGVPGAYRLFVNLLAAK